MPEIDQQSADAALAIKALASLSSVTPSSSPHNSRRSPPRASSPSYDIIKPSHSRTPSETLSTVQLTTSHSSLNRPNDADSDPTVQKPANGGPHVNSSNSTETGTSLVSKPSSTSSAPAAASQHSSSSTDLSTNALNPLPSSTLSSVSLPLSSLEKLAASSDKPISSQLPVKTTSFDKKLPSSPAEDEEPEIYSIDAGVIRCICGFTHDDGFTIQCEKCNAWQHAVCVNIENDQVPEVYFCDKCGKLSYDINAAKVYQIRRLKELKAQADLARSLNDEDSASRSKSRKRSSVDDDGNSEDETMTKRRRSHDDVKRSNNNTGVNNSSNNTDRGSSTGASPKVSSSRSSPAPSSGATTNATTTTSSGNRRGRTKRLTVPTGLPIPSKDDDNDNEPEKKFTLAQMYSSYFVSISENRFATPAVRNYVNSLPSNPDVDQDEITQLSATKYQNVKLPDLIVKLTSDHPKQKFSGFSRFGLFLENSVPRDRYLINYVGQVMTLQQYKSHPVNQYRQFGCPKPGVLFHPSLPICVDARLVGSKARFIRRSCRPNCKISTVVVDKTKVKFAVFSTESIEAGSELTIDWEWDQKHPARKLIDGVSPDQLTKQEKLFLEHVADMANQRGAECACNLPAGECIMMRMKKINGAPPRTTRMGNKSRRGNDSGDADGNSGVYGTEITDSAAFYSKREARKLQSAMELIERVSRNEESKRRKKEESQEVEESPSAESLVPASLAIETEEEKKPSIVFVDRAIQTPPITIPLRHYSEPRIKEKVTSTTTVNKYGPFLSRTLPKKRLFFQYMQAKKSYEKQLKTENSNGYSIAPLKTSIGISNSTTKSGTPSRLSITGKASNGSTSAGINASGLVGVSNVSSPSSPYMPSDEFSSRGTSKAPTPVPGSPSIIATFPIEAANNPSVSTTALASEPRTLTHNSSDHALSSALASTPPAATITKSTLATTSTLGLTSSAAVSSTTTTTNQSKTVKKLSFADYKKKKTNAQQK
jgi:hypothetical protein